jgi:hypothetical protein
MWFKAWRNLKPQSSLRFAKIAKKTEQMSDDPQFRLAIESDADSLLDFMRD